MRHQSLADRFRIYRSLGTNRRPSPLALVTLATGVAVALLAAGLVWLVETTPVPVAYAATITVNSTADVIDGTDGQCTLREAIIAVNTDTASGAVGGECQAGSGADTITLPAGTYTLALAGAGEDAAATGDLDITEDLTINGADAVTTIIDGGALDRVLDIRPGATVQISDVTIRNGNVTGSGGGIRNSGTLTLAASTVSSNAAATATDEEVFGGGIYSEGTLTLDNVTVSNSSVSNPGDASARGGGIANTGNAALTDTTVSDNTATTYGGGMFNSGTLTATDSTISNNTATRESGGGIYNDAGGMLTLTNTTISGNSAAIIGGGIYNFGSGTAVLQGNSVVSSNTATYSGGGIANFGTLTLNGATVNSNTTSGPGGGIFNGSTITVTVTGGTFVSSAIVGTLIMTDTTVSENSAGIVGGGIFNVGPLTVVTSTVRNNSAVAGGGGIFHGSDTTTREAVLTSSTISGNTVTGPGLDGGGIYNSAVMTATNVTFSSNTAPQHGANIRNVTPGALNLLNCTVFLASNTGDSSIHNTASAELKETIVAGGTGDTGQFVVTSLGYNLESANSCGLIATGDLINTDPLLGPLQLNSPGNTETHALLAGSPAIDAGSPDCPPPNTDQRGVTRPKGDTCDLGAFEDPVTLAASSGCYDFDGDGEVDGDDIQVVVARWRLTSARPDPDSDPATPNYDLGYDLDRDGVITVRDMMLVSAQWSWSCP